MDYQFAKTARDRVPAATRQRGGLTRRRGLCQELYEALEEREVRYAIRLPANDNLERDIAELLTRPVGRPSYKPVV